MSTANDKQRTPGVRWLDKLLPLLGITLVTGGFILLSWFAYIWLTPQTAPYHYHLVAEGEASQFPELELEAWPTLKISKYEIRVTERDKPIALAYFGQRGKRIAGAAQLGKSHWRTADRPGSQTIGTERISQCHRQTRLPGRPHPCLVGHLPSNTPAIRAQHPI